ncbi:unnamed protein product [Porites lobata]|uniref:Uncharacterized protein n=1 Tax=Porites lobata TaxID=104759 RepID=A0ABN8PUU0_9CNID|nr:unnamed protein product [Porites lobata]
MAPLPLRHSPKLHDFTAFRRRYRVESQRSSKARKKRKHSASWLDRTVCDADILIPGYTTFRQDRGPHKRGGGVLVYVKDIYKGCVIEKWSSVSESNFQQLQLKVQCKKFKSFLLCTVYRPPDAPIDF